MINKSVYYETEDDRLNLIIDPLINLNEESKMEIDKTEPKKPYGKSSLYTEFERFMLKKKMKFPVLGAQTVDFLAKIPEWVKRAQSKNSSNPQNVVRISPLKKTKLLKSKHNSDNGEYSFESGDENSNDMILSKNEYKDVWISSKKITSLAILKAKVILYYHITMQDYISDLESLVSHILKRCQNQTAKAYVSEIYEFALKMCTMAQGIFNLQMDVDLYDFYEEYQQIGQLRVLGNWEKKPMPRRQYYQIDKYIAGLEGDQTVFERMKTSLRGCCDGKHCQSFEELGPLSLADETWLSLCTDRKRKMECDKEKCGCAGKECKNRGITDRKLKKMGIDVQEIESWGIDWFTIRLIISVMPKNITEERIGKFVEESLNKALELQGSVGWDIRNSLRCIMSRNRNFSSLDRNIAKYLLNVVENNRHGVDAFKIHSKGIGVICISDVGIKKNELIQEYYGEIYAPWRWYEKQDIIKKGQNEGKISMDLPDFYNIMFERHKFDPDGYDILFVDPISKGSYCSRFSHSCNPNCSTVVMVADGRYSIGMYALRDITYGEELTFDYSSVFFIETILKVY